MRLLMLYPFTRSYFQMISFVYYNMSHLRSVMCHDKPCPLRKALSEMVYSDMVYSVSFLTIFNCYCHKPSITLTFLSSLE